MQIRNLPRLLVLGATLLGLVGCGGSPPSTPPPAPDNAATDNPHPGTPVGDAPAKKK